MGYQIQAAAPQIVARNGVTYAVGAFDWQNPAGSFYKFGIYRLDPSQGWIEVEAATYSNGVLLETIQKEGGMKKFMDGAIGYINGLFQKHCAPPVLVEPTTEEEAKAMITASTNLLSLTLVNGIPVLRGS